MATKYPMTPAGRRRLAEELEYLRTVERPEISQAIEEARAHGDLKENAEYHAAKDRQGMIEARVRELETKLSLAQIIDPTTVMASSTVRFGATVTLLDLDTNEEITYAIVGEDEADHKNGLLNFRAPIARSLITKEEGDDVSIELGTSTRNFEILQVEYKEIQLSDASKRV